MEGPIQLVNLTAHPGFADSSNYYWTHQARLNVTEEELRAAGLENGNAYVHPALIDPLVSAAAALRDLGYKMVIVDAWRPAGVYQIAKRTIIRTYDEEMATTLLNLKDMPHATGLAIDVELVNIRTGKQVWFRSPSKSEFKAGSWKIGFYLGRPGRRALRYLRLQAMLIGIMVSAGFKPGSKREFWHFQYSLPES